MNITKNGLYCKTCCYEMESSYMQEFYVGEKNKLHFAVVCPVHHCIIDVSRKISFFREKFTIHNKLNFEDLVYNLNEFYDYTNKSIIEIIEEYTNISMDIITAIGIESDELGCKYDMSYTSGLLKSPNFQVKVINGKEVVVNETIEFYKQCRIEEIDKRKHTMSEPETLPYPWGK